MIIHSSLIVDLFQYNTEWLYERLNDGFYDIRNLGTDDVKRIYINEELVKDIYIWSNTTFTSVSNYRKFRDLGLNIKYINYVSFIDDVYDKDNSFVKQSESVEKMYKYTREKSSICYKGCYISDIVSLEDHFKSLKYINMFLGRYIDEVYVDFNISRSLKNDKYIAVRDLYDDEREKVLDYIRKEFKIEPKIKPSFYLLNNKNEFDMGVENFCLSNDLTNESFGDVNDRILKQRLHMKDSTSLILTESKNEKIVY